MTRNTKWFVLAATLFWLPAAAQTRDPNCVGTKRAYKGQCLYPGEIEALKSQERKASEERERNSERQRQEQERRRSDEESDRRPSVPVPGKVHDFEAIECGDRPVEGAGGKRHWSKGEILVDGVSQGPTNEVISVLPGTRTFVIRSRIFRDYKEVLNIASGGSFEVKPKGVSRADMIPACLALVGLLPHQPEEDEADVAREEPPSSPTPPQEKYEPVDYSGPSWVELDDVTWPRALLGVELVTYVRINLSFPQDKVVFHSKIPFPIAARVHFYYWTKYVGFGIEASIVAGIWYTEVTDLDSTTPEGKARNSSDMASVKQADALTWNFVDPELYLGFRIAEEGFFSRLVLFASSRHSWVTSDRDKEYLQGGHRNLSLELHRVGGGLALKFGPWLTARAEYFYYFGSFQHEIGWHYDDYSMNYEYDISVHAVGARIYSLLYAGESFTIRLKGWFHLGVDQQVGGNQDGGFYALGVTGSLGYRW